MRKPPPVILALLLAAFVASVAAITHFKQVAHAPSTDPPDPMATALVNVASAVRRYFVGEHNEMLKRMELHGRAPAEVRRILGTEPTSSLPVRLGDGLSEFQVELYNFFPPDDPATEDVVVLEEQWRFDGYAVAVWYRRDEDRWTAFDSIEYPDGVEF